MLTAAASALGPVLGPVAADPIALDQAIGLLRKYSLLNREVDQETDLTRLSMHRMMQEILLDEMDESTRRLWAERAVRAIAYAFPAIPWPVLQAHARNCLQLIDQWDMTFPEAEPTRRATREEVAQKSEGCVGKSKRFQIAFDASLASSAGWPLPAPPQVKSHW